MTDPLSLYQANPASPRVSDLIKSFSGLMVSVGQMVEEKEEQYEQKIEHLQSNQQSPYSNIIGNGKRKEVIAILNAMYELGLIGVGITKAELFTRLSVACGDTGLKDYASALSQVMQTYKYDNVFDELADMGKQIRERSDKK